MCDRLGCLRSRHVLKHKDIRKYSNVQKHTSTYAGTKIDTFKDIRDMYKDTTSVCFRNVQCNW